MAESILLNNEKELLKSRLKDYQQLFKIIQSISSSLHLEKILQQIILEAVSLCNASQGSILLFDMERKEIIKTLNHSTDSRTVILDNYLNTLLAEWVNDNSKFLCTNSLVYTFNENLIKEKYHDIESVLSIPIGEEKKIIGVINLVSLNKSYQFDKWEVEILGLLARQCVNIIENATMHESLFKESSRLRKELEESNIFKEVVGNSPKMRDVLSILERVIPTEARVLIEGENGTGKKLIARLFHYNGPNKHGPFISVDCKTLPVNMLESEFFGFEKGAFIGATQDKIGLFEEADNGTLFLDEITSLPLSIQSKLLRVLQEGEIRPVGSNKTKKVQVRVVTAANNGLKEMLQSGSFIEDLYYHLSVVTLKLPPLRERNGDILFLTDHFIQKFADKYEKQINGVTNEALQLLEVYSWPGNIHELRNVIERMVILAEQDTSYLSVDLLPADLQPLKPSTSDKNSKVNIKDSESMVDKKIHLEKELLGKALIKNNWHQSLAAKELGIHESTLRYKMKKLGIRKPG